MDNTGLTVVVCCNKKDFFLAKICIASIRYFYPEIPIELVKDFGNGYFSSKKLEQVYKVKNIDLGIKKIGWGAAKFHYLFHMPLGKKVFLLDADIIFLGPFLNRMERLSKENDYVVSAEKHVDPYSEYSKITYFDTREVERKFSDYKFPGYFFNTGQVFVTVGSIEKDEIAKYFDQSTFPYWKDQSLFPLVDQSVYNYLLPTLSSQGKLKLATDNFVIWSRSNIANDINLESITSKSCDVGVLHWAGDIRTPFLKQMNRSDILEFFEDNYYRSIPFGRAKQFITKIIPVSEYYMRLFYHKIKN